MHKKLHVFFPQLLVGCGFKCHINSKKWNFKMHFLLQTHWPTHKLKDSFFVSWCLRNRMKPTLCLFMKWKDVDLLMLANFLENVAFSLIWNFSIDFTMMQTKILLSVGWNRIQMWNVALKYGGQLLIDLFDATNSLY